MADRTQFVFLQSVNRQSGTAYNAEYVFDTGAVACRPGEKMFVTLRAMSVPHTWKQINSGVNDTFTVGARTVTIPAGSCPFKSLAALLNTLLQPENATVSWDSDTMLFTFDFQTAHQLRFSSNLAAILGFGQSETPQGTLVVSSRPVQSLASAQYLIRLEGLSCELNCDNSSAGGEIKPAPTLACVFDTSVPGGTLIFDDSFASYTLAVKDSLQRFRIVWQDFNENVVSYIPDHSVVLQIDFKQADPTGQLLAKINESLELLLAYLTLPA